MRESVKKLQNLLDRIVEECEKKGLTINYCKKTEGMSISKRKMPICELKIKDINIKCMQKFTYLGRVLTDDGICDTKCRTQFGLTKASFQTLEKVSRNGKRFVRMKEI